MLCGDLWVSNGTQLELEVSVDGSTIQIAPGDNREVGRFPAGAVELVAKRKSDGLELDRRTVVFQRTQTHVYNVLGASPVVLSTIRYSVAASSGGGTPPTETSLCGTDFLASHVDFVFTDPPRTIQLEKRSGELLRTALALQPGGYTSCLRSLASQPIAAATLAARLASVFEQPEARANLSWFAALLYARHGDASTALALANVQLQTDDSMEGHRSYQGVLKVLGRQWQAKETYRTRFEAERGERNAYLYARLLPSKEAMGVLQPWASGEDTWVHRALLWQHAVVGDFDDVLKEAQWCLSRLPPNDELRPLCIEERARARVGKGEAGLALTELEEIYEKVPRLDFEAAILIDRVALKAERKPRFTPFAKLPQEAGDQAVFRNFYELTRGGPPSKHNGDARIFTVLDEGRTNPRHALQLIDTQPDGLRYVGAELAGLLLGEGLRTRERSVSRKLHNLLPPSFPLEDLEAWVLDGEERVDFSDFDEHMRAALYFARGRRLESIGEREKAEVLYRKVRATDLLDGLAVRALAEWPTPERSSEGVLERVDNLVLPRQ